MMDKNSVDYAFQMFYDFCRMSDEEFKEKYPDEPDEFIHPVHGKQVDTWDGMHIIIHALFMKMDILIIHGDIWETKEA